jgi:hypothetical protein
MINYIITFYWPYFQYKHKFTGFSFTVGGKLGRKLLTKATVLTYTIGRTGNSTDITCIHRIHQIQSRTGAFGMHIRLFLII